jgi:hypothetical protein
LEARFLGSNLCHILLNRAGRRERFIMIRQVGFNVAQVDFWVQTTDRIVVSVGALVSVLEVGILTPDGIGG